MSLPVFDSGGDEGKAKATAFKPDQRGFRLDSLRLVDFFVDVVFLAAPDLAAVFLLVFLVDDDEAVFLAADFFFVGEPLDSDDAAAGFFPADLVFLVLLVAAD